MYTRTTDRRRIDTCPECEGHVRRSESSERVCRHCGLVLTGPEIERATGHSGGPTTPTRPNRGLSTWMGSCGRDGQGNRIGERRRRRLRRQRRRQRRTAADATRETLGPGLKETARVASALDLPESVAETASVVFRRALDGDLLQGWAVEGIAAGSVAIATQQSGAVRSLDEVTAVARLSRRRVARAVRYLKRELELAVRPPDAVEYLPNLCAGLAVPERTRRRAGRLLEAATEATLHSGRDPTALAASALYTVTLVDDTAPDLCQTTVGDAADTSPSTVRRQFRELRPLCPDVFDVTMADIQNPTDRAGHRSDCTPHRCDDVETGAD